MELFAEIYIDHDGLTKMFRAALAGLASLHNGLDKIHSADVLVPRLSRFVASQLNWAIARTSTRIWRYMSTTSISTAVWYC